jgi:predicted lipoprotein with Yx(FWY)xxD motif
MPAPTLVNTAESPRLGPILVDSRGMTLYTFTNGVRPASCTGECGTGWSPVLAPAEGHPTAGPGVSGVGKSKSGTVVTYWGYPLARFSGDKAPGDTNGDLIRGEGGQWHAIHLAKACRPLVAPVTTHLMKGQSIGINGGTVGVVYVAPHANSDLTTFDPAEGKSLVDLTGPLTLQLLPAGGGGTASVCM